MSSRLLVVAEDEAAQRELLVQYRGRHNLRVNSAESGAELRRLAARDSRAVVLLDIKLFGGNGSRWLWLHETRPGSPSSS